MMAVPRLKSGSKNMKISQEGIALIKKFEGCPTDNDGNATAYRCAANKPTIGFGSLHLIDGSPVQDGMKISAQEAEDLLKHELTKFEDYINDMVNVPIQQCMFDALVAWCFNIGPTNARGSSAVRLLNEGKYDEVPARMKLYNKATVNGQKVTLEGLVRRREAEALLFVDRDWTQI